MAATAPEVNVTAGRFYKCLRDAIAASAIATEFFGAEKTSEDELLFNNIYPIYGQLAIECAEKFDVIVMDPDKYERSKDVLGGLAYPANKYGKVIYDAA